MIRRTFDCCAGAFGLAIAAVPLAVSVFLIWATSRGPVIYRQTRIGRGGRPFCLYKLRTMSGPTMSGPQVGPQVTAIGDPRVSRVGRVLRQFKLDELPQLWNVLKGDMSIVGPRPEVPRFVDQYTSAQRAILAATPGLASMAQLVYPHEARLLCGHPDPESAYVRYLMPRKIDVDLQYERTRTLWSDLELLAEIGLLLAGKSFRIDRLLDVPSPPGHRSDQRRTINS